MIKISIVSRMQEVIEIEIFKLNLAWNTFLLILTVFGTCIWTALYSMGILKNSDKRPATQKK